MQKIAVIVLLFMLSTGWAKQNPSILKILLEGEVQFGLSMQSWDYFESTELFRRRQPILEHKTLHELRGFVQTEFSVMKSQKIFNYAATSKDVCEDLNGFYQGFGIANGLSQLSVALVSGARHPVCRVFYLKNQAVTEQLVFLGRLKGRSPASPVYLTHTLTLTYPEGLKQQAELEIAKVLPTITRDGK